MSIQYIAYQNIDKQKWDNCIEHSPNGLIYAYSYYLNAMAKHWDALVLNDYETVMPLTWNKKYGIHYLYQPFFCASLGVFGKNITVDIVNEFLKNIPVKFSYWDIYLNAGNYFSGTEIKMYERINYVLHLNQPYEILFKNFRENTKRNIKKCDRLGFVCKKNIPVDEIINLANEHAKSYSPITQGDFDRFSNLYSYQFMRHSHHLPYCYYT